MYANSVDIRLYLKTINKKQKKPYLLREEAIIRNSCHGRRLVTPLYISDVIRIDRRPPYCIELISVRKNSSYIFRSSLQLRLKMSLAVTKLRIRNILTNKNVFGAYIFDVIIIIA